MDYITLENKLQSIFGINDYALKNQVKRKITFGGILYDNIKFKGGLFTALSVVLAPYYYKDVEEIEDFLYEIDDRISELSLEEINKKDLKEIMDKFDSIIKKVKEK